MGFQAAATAAGLKGEYNHNLRAAHMPGPVDYMRGRIDHIRMPAQAEYMPERAAHIPVLAVDNFVPAENILVPAENILVSAVHKRATVADSPAFAEHKRLAAD